MNNFFEMFRMNLIEKLSPFILQLLPPIFFGIFEECIVVFINYRWSSVFIAIILTLTQVHDQRYPPVCVSKFDRSREITDEQMDMCLTYPFTEGDSRNNVLHYKWMPYVFGFILLCFVLLQLALKFFRDPRVEVFLCDLTNEKDEEQRFFKCLRYFTQQIGRHRHLQLTRFKVLLSCLFTHFVVFLVLNLSLGGFYLKLPMHLNQIRDMENLSDPISMVMPPFIQCKLTPQMNIWMDRTEEIGCYFPLMEIYERAIVFLWFWQTICVILLLKSLLVHLFYPDPYPHLVPHRPETSGKLISSLATTGDVVLLARVRPLIRSSDFQKLLEEVAQVVNVAINPSEISLEEGVEEAGEIQVSVDSSSL